MYTLGTFLCVLHLKANKQKLVGEEGACPAGALLLI